MESGDGMKTRDEQIEEAIRNGYYAEYDGGRGYDEPEAFRDGVQWADANPSPEVAQLIEAYKILHKCLTDSADYEFQIEALAEADKILKGGEA